MNDYRNIKGIAIYLLLSVPLLILSFSLTKHPLLIISIYCLITLVFFVSFFHAYIFKMRKYHKNEQKLFYQALNDAKSIAIIWSSDLKTFRTNDCLFDKTGYCKETTSMTDIINKIFQSSVAKYKNYDFKNTDAETETVIHCADGKTLSIAWKTTQIQTRRKAKVFMSVGLDITEIKNIQNELSASEGRYELSMELSEIGLIFKNIGEDTYYISKNLCTRLGFSSQYVPSSELINKIHPIDRPLFITHYKSSEENALNDMHKVTSLELRILDRNGGYRWYKYRYKISEGFNSDNMVMGGSLIHISKEKEKDTLIEKMAYIDEVTQIFNRNKFMTLGQETYSCARDLNLSYWLIIFDVDKFHIINDTCGYQNGNVLLKDIAITILKNLSEGGFCARIGGDNFAILIHDNGDEKFPIDFIQDIQTSVSALACDVFSNQNITVSAGYCKLPEDGDDFSQVLEHAEFALRLGQEPRQNIVKYDYSVHDKIIAKTKLEKELKNALAHNELKLFYQPKINLTTNKLMGVEALIRWIKPDGTIIPPNNFIPVAESSNLITKISEFVVNEACRQNKIWQDKGLPMFNISVNLSSVDFYQTDVCKTIKDALEDSGLNPELLEIELTESLALKDVEQAIKQMNELKQIGVKISMDDFGTGYSSLSYIQVLPITLLKLDRSFIMYLEEDEISRQIVSSVINICKSKKIEIIAEGIETPGQAEILKESGCDHAQGYYFGKPMTSEAFEEYMSKAI